MTTHQGGSAGGAERRHPSGTDPALETVGLTKRFGALVANDDISLQVPVGTIHAVVGENGAGKTTLMRMVYGLYSPDNGTIRLRGEDVSFRSPRDALAHGVAMVHQTSLLVGSMSVTENVMLSLSGRGRPSRRDVVERLARFSGENGLGLDPRATVDTLSVGLRQRAEILGALYHEASLLILDEPTTVLTPREAEKLFAVLRDLTARGTTVLLVTHKLREVLAVTDDVTVLRGGRVVGQAPTSELDEKQLVRLMVGRSVPLQVREAALTSETAEPDRPTDATVPSDLSQSPVPPDAAEGPVVLDVQGLVVVDNLGSRRLHDVDLAVRQGEIVGVTGVEGNGQRELVEAIVGLRRVTSGTVRIAAEDVTTASVRRRRRLGLAYIPESRATEGVAGGLSVEDNIVLGRHHEATFRWYGLRRMKEIRQFARRQIEEFGIVAGGPTVHVDTLSGGNAQKVVVAREVAKGPKVLLAVQPTQGVDVAAAYAIRTTLQRLRDQGMSILLITSDLREACDLCDRAVVLYNGAVAGEVPRENATEQRLGTLAMGLAS